MILNKKRNSTVRLARTRTGALTGALALIVAGGLYTGPRVAFGQDSENESSRVDTESNGNAPHTRRVFNSNENGSADDVVIEKRIDVEIESPVVVNEIIVQRTPHGEESNNRPVISKSKTLSGFPLFIEESAPHIQAMLAHNENRNRNRNHSLESRLDRLERMIGSLVERKMSDNGRDSFYAERSSQSKSNRQGRSRRQSATIAPTLPSSLKTFDRPTAPKLKTFDFKSKPGKGQKPRENARMRVRIDRNVRQQAEGAEKATIHPLHKNSQIITLPIKEMERDAQRIYREAEEFAEHMAKIPQAHVRNQTEFYLKTSDFHDLQRHTLKAQKKILEAQLKALDEQLIHLDTELNRVDDQVNKLEFTIEVKGAKGEGNSKYEHIHEHEADHDPFKFFSKDLHDENSIPHSDQDDGDY